MKYCWVSRMLRAATFCSALRIFIDRLGSTLPLNPFCFILSLKVLNISVVVCTYSNSWECSSDWGGWGSHWWCSAPEFACKWSGTTCFKWTRIRLLGSRLRLRSNQTKQNALRGLILQGSFQPDETRLVWTQPTLFSSYYNPGLAIITENSLTLLFE